MGHSVSLTGHSDDGSLPGNRDRSSWLVLSTKSSGRTLGKEPLARELPPSCPLASRPVLPEAPPVGPSPRHTGSALLLGVQQRPRSRLPGPGPCSLTALTYREKLLEAKTEKKNPPPVTGVDPNLELFWHV